MKNRYISKLNILEILCDLIMKDIRISVACVYVLFESLYDIWHLIFYWRPNNVSQYLLHLSDRHVSGKGNFSIVFSFVNWRKKGYCLNIPAWAGYEIYLKMFTLILIKKVCNIQNVMRFSVTIMCSAQKLGMSWSFYTPFQFFI